MSDRKQSVYYDEKDARIATLEAENAALRAESNLYHEVMRCLNYMQMSHGRCQPREDRACTNCNSADRLKGIQANYKGQKAILADSLPKPPGDTE